VKFGVIFSILLVSGTFVVPLNTNVVQAHDILLYSNSQTNGSGDDNTPPTTRERCFVTVTVRAYAEHHDGIHHRNNPDKTFYPGDAFGYETSVTKNGCIANSLKGCKMHSSATLSAPKNNLGCSAGDSATWGGTSDSGTAGVVPTYAGGAIWIEKEGFALQRVCHTDSDGDTTCTSIPVYASVNLPVPGRLPNMTLDMWTVGEEFTDDEGYLSRNLDETYYVWDAINVVHNPFYLFKNERVGTIFVEYEKIHDPLNLEEEFFCDAALCVNTMSLSGFEDWIGTFDYGGGNTVFNATSIADYGEHEIRYIARLYNIGPQIDQTEQFIRELVVEYDPIYDAYVFTVLQDDGKIAFDDRIGYALHYFGSESTAANPDDVIGVHEDRRSKINDYFFTAWGADPWVYQFIDGSVGASPFSDGVELTWDEAHDVGIVTPESPVAISVAIGADLISSTFPGVIPFEVNSDGTANFLKAGYGKIKFDYDGLDDVVVDPILKIPRYENATIFNILESDHFAGFENTFLTDSMEYMYPENHFWNTIGITALDKDGNVDGTVDLELTVIPNYSIAGTFDIDEYLYDKVVFDTDDDGFAQIITGLDSMGNDIVIVNGDEIYPLDNLIMEGNGSITLEKTRRVLTSFTQYAEVADQAFDPNNVPDISDKYLLDTGDAIMAIPLTTSLQTLNPYELQITASNNDGGGADSVTHTFEHPWYEFSIDYNYTLNMADDNVLDLKRDPANPRIMFYKYNENFGTVESLSINGIVITGDDELPSCFGVKSVGICPILVPESEYLAELDITAENMWGGTASVTQPEIEQIEPVIPNPVEAILGLHVYDWVLVLIILMVMLVLGYKAFKRFFLSNY